MHFANI